jgi:hypothetical protein
MVDQARVLRPDASDKNAVAKTRLLQSAAERRQKVGLLNLRRITNPRSAVTVDRAVDAADQPTDVQPDSKSARKRRTPETPGSP